MHILEFYYKLVYFLPDSIRWITCRAICFWITLDRALFPLHWRHECQYGHHTCMHACMHAPYWHMHMTATILFDGLDRLLHTRLVSIYSQSLAVILRPLSSFWEDAREQWRSRGNCFFTTGIELVFGREHILTHWLIEVRFFLPLPLGERQNTVLNEISFLSLFIFIFCDQE